MCCVWDREMQIWSDSSMEDLAVHRAFAFSPNFPFDMRVKRPIWHPWHSSNQLNKSLFIPDVILACQLVSSIICNTWIFRSSARSVKWLVLSGVWNHMRNQNSRVNGKEAAGRKRRSRALRHSSGCYFGGTALTSLEAWRTRNIWLIWGLSTEVPSSPLTFDRLSKVGLVRKPTKRDWLLVASRVIVQFMRCHVGECDEAEWDSEAYDSEMEYSKYRDNLCSSLYNWARACRVKQSSRQQVCRHFHRGKLMKGFFGKDAVCMG